MDTNLWIRGPLGPDASARRTRVCKNVLVVVPTVAAGTRLLDVLPLVEADFRAQALFTVPHTTDVWPGLGDFVRAQGGLAVPWQQAVRHRWDLVLAASHRHLPDLDGPILLLPHGAGAAMSRRYSRKAGGAQVPTTGLDRELLTYRGRALPAALALPHEDELSLLGRLCPEALDRAEVTGDICLDRMRASLPFRHQYRQALGVPDDELLVTVSSTWSPDSLFGRLPRLCRALLDEFAHVALVLHPQVWTVHGRRQIAAWLSDCPGLRLIPPDEGWRATMIAADWVIGDHGSTTAYAAATGRPVTLATCPDVREGSIAAVVREHAPQLRRNRGLAGQRAEAVDRAAVLQNAVLPAITSRPDAAAPALRALIYRLLGLPEPSHAPAAGAVPLPRHG
ncbi:hypothetical protein FHX82_003259 [Amycolatopsis bartoniae]|uniref:Uncharacterized protein n=1 Tax=Amycolatopsis bartoniae TaxID=941986 RepID=A0A8H9MGH7_9PSEU|nr:hypothetical protein [Amycolatopsis bartoniae]MBB2936205.1 hypothetical protein [Amycolatopsis bartoniae]TVT07089.1 hypothetical protein FNH07_17265 [Amycolatopsis bartoniae]GHF80815.1 hypothetical protein GCM10017566_63680 [Amycolatopsis bartoniae]